MQACYQEDLPVFMSCEQIATANQKLAERITHEYHDTCPILLPILKGAMLFASDLMRLLHFDLHVECVIASSYRDSQVATALEITDSLPENLQGRHVLLVDTILDTGVTLSAIRDRIQKKNPASIALCVLVKKNSRVQQPVNPDYLACEAGDEFLVGYGTDLRQKYRNLPHLAIAEKELA